MTAEKKNCGMYTVGLPDRRRPGRLTGRYASACDDVARFKAGDDTIVIGNDSLILGRAISPNNLRMHSLTTDGLPLLLFINNRMAHRKRRLPDELTLSTAYVPICDLPTQCSVNCTVRGGKGMCRSERYFKLDSAEVERLQSTPGSLSLCCF